MSLTMTIRALVVDGFPEHVAVLVQTLNHYGVDALGTNSGKEGLTLYRDRKPHLVIVGNGQAKLTDGMRFWLFGHKLLGNEFSDRPYMVALDGDHWAGSLNKRLAEECGFDDYTYKPIELSTLLKWVENARLRAEGQEIKKESTQ